VDLLWIRGGRSVQDEPPGSGGSVDKSPNACGRAVDRLRMRGGGRVDRPRISCGPARRSLRMTCGSSVQHWPVAVDALWTDQAPAVENNRSLTPRSLFTQGGGDTCGLGPGRPRVNETDRDRQPIDSVEKRAAGCGRKADHSRVRGPESIEDRMLCSGEVAARASRTSSGQVDGQSGRWGSPAPGSPARWRSVGRRCGWRVETRASER